MGHTPGFTELPAELPIFPLHGVLLLPRGRLPLNVFEPRYLAMVDDALAGNRLIGILQPDSTEDHPPVMQTGCAGRIVCFTETDDGRYLISLDGVCRFQIGGELPMRHGYRLVQPEWNGFRDDLQPETCDGLDRARLLTLLQGYFRKQDLSADWAAIESAPDERLLTSLAMICPFEPQEKQALLEAPTLSDRARIMLMLLQMAVADLGDPARARH